MTAQAEREGGGTAEEGGGTWGERRRGGGGAGGGRGVGAGAVKKYFLKTDSKRKDLSDERMPAVSGLPLVNFCQLYAVVGIGHRMKVQYEEEEEEEEQEQAEEEEAAKEAKRKNKEKPKRR